MVGGWAGASGGYGASRFGGSRQDLLVPQGLVAPRVPERLRLLREQRRELDVRPVHAPRRAHREVHQLAHLAEAARDRHLQPPAALERGVEVGAQLPRHVLRLRHQGPLIPCLLQGEAGTSSGELGRARARLRARSSSRSPRASSS